MKCCGLFDSPPPERKDRSSFYPQAKAYLAIFSTDTPLPIQRYLNSEQDKEIYEEIYDKFRGFDCTAKIFKNIRDAEAFLIDSKHCFIGYTWMFGLTVSAEEATTIIQSGTGLEDIIEWAVDFSQVWDAFPSSPLTEPSLSPDEVKLLYPTNRSRASKESLESVPVIEG